MVFELRWRPEADEAMAALEVDPSMWQVVEAIERTLDRLEADPFDPRLGTVPFQTPGLGGICATPVRRDDWCVLWQRGEVADQLVIILIHRLSVG